MNSGVSIITVSHNSHAYVAHYFKYLDRQTVKPDQIIIIDSGSDDIRYLNDFAQRDDCIVHGTTNIGYAAANNLGVTLVDQKSGFILFINPDTFLEDDFIEKALSVMSRNENISILTGLLQGYDLDRSCVTGKIDSAGIFRKWYGRWYDRGQGENYSDSFYESGEVPAICGALMFCRVGLLKEELPRLFDESFFMYKEDIELCVRLRKNIHTLYFANELLAFHCRGWNNDRRKIERSVRLRAAVNEIKLYRKHPSPFICWAIIKYALVKWFDV